ncbi:glycosyltransferase [Candidatus Roizmanbacteria bacterium CG_4_10_14_0_8_um_filter_33_9]|uniref:Glycosyltransferase n=1 Tax=Candidatus Roizmanbacteria bacterium CG_4_10_14_0_8_um_filter_33_9 TaxID=1974826 RepID=A0A2M7QI02_9BACT|nr:MAG: glycosyltransferase [Candidatus Roizmanbacteria bacterium CG_4_10_14_0_8_um_filter_33_9]
MKKELPSISIITPSFNQGRFIKQTIDSVLSQQYPNLEYIVIDGGSTDDTISILKSYGNNIIWESKKDKGQTSALNKGFKRATGEIIAYLNSDDVYLPNTLLTVGEHFLEHPETMWVTGDYFIIDAENKKIQSFVASYKKYLRKKPSFSSLCVANYIVQPSTFWRSSLFNEIGYFNESFRYCMDYDFWIRIIQKYPPTVLSRHFSLFRIHDTSKGGTQYKMQFEEEHRVVISYTKKIPIIYAHKIHAQLIAWIYTVIK